MMWTQLLALVQHSPVLLSVSAGPAEGTLRLVVTTTPKDAEKRPDLVQPLSIVATPHELESGLAEVLARFERRYAGLKEAIENAEAAMEAAKAARTARAAKKAAEASSAKHIGRTVAPALAAPSPATKDEESADDDEVDDQPTAPANAGGEPSTASGTAATQTSTLNLFG